MTMPHGHPLRTESDLDDAVARSAAGPVLIYKHSSTCGTSAMAAEEIRDLRAGRLLPIDVFSVTVQTHRALSDAIARRLAIRHETPQALLICGGRVVWHASHFRVTAEAITKALVRLEGEPACQGATTKS